MVICHYKSSLDGLGVLQGDGELEEFSSDEEVGLSERRRGFFSF